LNTIDQRKVRSFMNTHVAFGLLAVSLTVLGATASGTAQESRAELSAVGATLTGAQFYSEPATAAALAARARGVASVLTGAEVRTVTPEAVSRAFSITPGRADILIESAGRVRILINSAQNELLAVNGVVADDVTSDTDVGAERAHVIFDEAMKALASRKLTEFEGVDLGKVRVGRMMQAETPPGGKAVPRVKEYLFEVPRAVAGVEVFGASVTIAVHRSGQIASIRTLGPEVSRSSETFKRVISASALIERVRRDNPGGEVTPLGLRYPWKAALADIAVAVKPRETFRVVPVAIVEGRTIHGRSHYEFYAVDNDQEPPIIWPKPNPEATGDRRK
jgi:hypothetical protein